MKNDLKTEISEKTSQNMLIKKEKIYENLCKQEEGDLRLVFTDCNFDRDS